MPEPSSPLAPAIAALQAGDRAAAAAAVRRLLVSNAQLGDGWAGTARIASAIGEIDLADAAMQRFVLLDPGDRQRLLQRAAMLAEAGRIDAAARSIEPLAAAEPADPRIDHFLATLKSQQGDFAAAQALFRRALEGWPLSGHSWLGLAATHRYRAGDAELGALLAQRGAMAGAAPDARAAYLYALGKAQDDIGAHDEAFAAFEEGAALVRAARAYDGAKGAAQVEAIIAGFGADAIGRLSAPASVDTSRPIFVTGVPRSGTTLVEQMLIAHSAVGDGAEINLFRHVVRMIGGASADAARAFAGRDGGWERAAGLYLHLLEQRLPAAGRAVDKSLNSSRVLGLISVILPDAPLIWVRRDPLDTGWSCFRTFFRAGAEWSWALEDIAHHIRLEARLLDHWRTMLGERLLVIDYETLVADPEAQHARILAHCGLAHEPLDGFNTVERAVLTSSVAQVREPVYRRSVGAAGPYRRHLQPFIDAYGAG